MREIICVGVGGTGKSILHQTYSMLKEVGQSESDVYFRETSSGDRIPRALWVDLHTEDQQDESDCTDRVIVYGDRGTGNWAKGYYTIGEEGLDTFREIIRKRVEETDSHSGFLNFHNLSGGAGGGLTGRLIELLSEDYSNSISQAFSVAPNIRNGGGHAHGYNVMLSLAKLQENVDRISWIDSEVAEEKGQRLGFLPVNASYRHIDRLIADFLSDSLLSYALPSNNKVNLAYENTLLCPFSDLRYTMISAPSLLQNRRSKRYSVAEMWSADIISKFTFSAASLSPIGGQTSLLGAVLSTSVWGSPSEIEEITRAISRQTPYPFRTELYRLMAPDDSLAWRTRYKAPSTPPPASSIDINTITVNTPEISAHLGRWSGLFRSLFDRRAGLHWYLSEGMEEFEFTEAQTAVNRVQLLYDAVCAEVIGGEGDEDVVDEEAGIGEEEGRESAWGTGGGGVGEREGGEDAVDDICEI